MAIRVSTSEHQERILRRIWGAGLEQIVFEALLCEGYRRGDLTRAEMGELLGLSARSDIDRWLADRRVSIDYGPAELREDRDTLDQALGKTG